VVYWSFRTMVGSGLLMLALAAFGVYLVVRNRFTDMPWFLKLLPFAIFLPYIANTAGWLMTEIGRQPWIVFGLQMTQDAVSPNVSTGMVALSLVLFTVIYGVLMAADVYLLMKFGKGGPDDSEGASQADDVLATA
jgi:cytochrome d ubiquinol oxidase subunit I